MKRPLLYCAVSFSIGIAAGYFYHLPLVPSLLSAGILMAACGIFLNNRLLSRIFLYLALAFLGLTRFETSQMLPQDHISNFISGKRAVLVYGVVANDPLPASALYGSRKTVFTVKAKALKGPSGWKKISGLVRVSLYSDGRGDAPEFGQEIAMRGFLSRPKGSRNFGLFDYSSYLKMKGIYAVFTVNGVRNTHVLKRASLNVPRVWAYSFRHRIREAIDKNIREPYGAFLKAVLIGDRGWLEESVKDDFVKTGTVHVLAISGLHMGLIAAMCFFVFRFLGLRRRWNLVFTAFILIIYAFIAGSGPPVVRSAIMFSVFAIGYFLRREPDVINTVSLAALLILLWNPGELFNPGLQLSFVSVVGIILLAPRIGEFLPVKNRYLNPAVSVSLAATLASAPLVAKYFNIFSPMAIIANLIIIPLLFPIVSLSFLFIAVSFLPAGAAHIAWALIFLTKFVFWINHILSTLPLAYIRVPAPAFSVILLYYLFLFSFFFVAKKRLVLILFLAVVNCTAWAGVIKNSDNNLKLTFFDVGKGDSCLIEFPDKGVMLIDAGSGGISGNFDAGRGIIAPSLWNKGIRRIDLLLVTHFHEDHAGGVPYLLENFDIGCVMDPDIVPEEGSRLFDRYRRIVRDRGIRRLVVARSDEITGFGRTRIVVMNPAQVPRGDANDDSVVIKMDHANFGSIFCGDISSGTMRELMSYGKLLKSDVMKVPHHGGDVGNALTAKKFFEAVSPLIAVTSSDKKTGQKFLAAPKKYNTASDGAIKMISDGAHHIEEVSAGK